MEEEKRIEKDDQASSRKKDHIDLAFKSSTPATEVDDRFYYEPILSGHHTEKDLSISLAGKKMSFPIWVSSMTGGTEKAQIINENLGKICLKYGLGMGLGSCRQLLYEDTRLDEFAIRKHIGNQPLMANLGIAQVESLVAENELSRIEDLLGKLDADGLIIHINHLQEWLQPEGDIIHHSPLETIGSVLAIAKYPIIIKEVGQGFGEESLNELLKLPLEALDLAGFGGTNFSKLELLRSNPLAQECLGPVLNLGHTCKEMLAIIQRLQSDNTVDIRCKKIIFSGGIKNFLDGYYLTQLCPLPSMYAQASAFLRHAMDLEQLDQYTAMQIEGLQMAHALLNVKR